MIEIDTEVLTISTIFLIIIIIFAWLITSFCKNVVYETLMENMENIENIKTTKNPYVKGYANKDDPHVKPFVLKNVLSKDDCDLIINHCIDKLEESEEMGGKYVNTRYSQHYWISKNNPLVKPAFERMAKMFNIPFENAEDLQVVKYLPKQYYGDHHDSCCELHTKCTDFVKRGGQRILTVQVYLNDDFTNGETYFKNLDIKMKPGTGNAIIFYPLAIGTNKCHPDALHSNLPVSTGFKWIMNIWFRENKFV